MWRRKRQSRLTAALLTALMLGGAFAQQAEGAQEADSPEKEISLTVEFFDGEQKVEGGSFCLYKVAETTGEAGIVWTEDFGGYPVSGEGLDSAGWKALAETLAAYCARDNLEPSDTGVTGADGTVRFPTGEEALTPGLYLVAGETAQAGGIRYTPEPFLAGLPQYGTGHGAGEELTYDVTVSVKYDREETDDSSDTINLRVLKVWEDQGHESCRPSRIAVQLLRDGAVWDTAVLNEEKSWRHVWEALERGHRWQITEEQVPAGYTVKSGQEGTSFVLTNTYSAPDRPGAPHKPSGGGGGRAPSVTLTDENVPLEGIGLPDKLLEISGDPVPLEQLPRTGALWWPVPWLSCGGMVFFALGRGRFQREKFCKERKG